MRNVFCLISFIFASTYQLFSQPKEFTVGPGLEMKSPKTKLNYDLYRQKITFIEKNDTIDFMNDASLKFLQIGTEILHHDLELGYFKIIASDGEKSLLSQVVLMGSRNGKNYYGLKYAHSTFYYLMDKNAVIKTSPEDVFPKGFLVVKQKSNLI